jgi:APA family basic amino acid/polyamine antiporter
MALDGLFLRGVDRAHARVRTPYVAIAVQAIFASGVLLLLERFERALDYTTFAIVLATLADVLALYRLRRTQPDRPRPYRAWGHPVVPALYLVANAGVAVALMAGRPMECAMGLLLLALGLPFYLSFRRRAPA